MNSYGKNGCGLSVVGYWLLTENLKPKTYNHL